MFNSTELFYEIDDFFLKFEATYWQFLKQSHRFSRIRAAHLSLSEITFIAIWYKCSHFTNFKAFFTWLKQDKSSLFKSIIFIKFGLKDLFPESKIGERKREYVELKNIEILLRGIGKNVLVQYKFKAKDYQVNDVQIKVKVEIPNDSLLIVRRSYSH